MPSLEQGRLRYAILCDSVVLARWQTECLDRIAELPQADPVAVMVATRSTSNMGERIGSRRYYLASRLWSWLQGRSDYCRAVGMSVHLAARPVLSCRFIDGADGSLHIGQEDLAVVRGYRLDFILSFAGSSVPIDLLSAARYGIWAFHHGDWHRYRGEAPAFWEVYHGENVTGAALIRLTGQADRAVVLKSGLFRTKRYSYRDNLSEILSRGTRWPAQVCTDLINNSADYLADPPQHTKAPIRSEPGNLQMLYFAWVTLCYIVTTVMRSLFRHEQWTVGLVRTRITEFLTPDYRPEASWFQLLKRKEFAADPFGIVQAGQLKILYEHLDQREGRGYIASLAVDGGGWQQGARVAIGPSARVHMSYPYMIEYKGDIYCVPETFEAREVALYRAEEFPVKWMRVATLINDTMAVDSTVFHHDGYWWLMCASAVEGPYCADLFLWYSKDLFGPWVPHPANPVKSDVRSARPAGTPFVHQGFLYRPAQDCSRTYGGRIVINRVLTLTPTAFKEEPVAVVELDPDGPYPDGPHTLSAAGEFTLIDGKRHIFVPAEFKRAVRRITRMAVARLTA